MKLRIVKYSELSIRANIYLSFGFLSQLVMFVLLTVPLIDGSSIIGLGLTTMSSGLITDTKRIIVGVSKKQSSHILDTSVGLGADPGLLSMYRSK